jgi:hypothetical protein
MIYAKPKAKIRSQHSSIGSFLPWLLAHSFILPASQRGCIFILFLPHPIPIGRSVVLFPVAALLF